MRKFVFSIFKFNTNTMKIVAIIIPAFLFAISSYCQDMQVKSIHNRHQMSMSILHFSNADTATFFIGNLETTGKTVCNGNIVHLDRKYISKLQDTVVINLSVTDSALASPVDFVKIGPHQVLKMRLRRFESFRVPKRKQLKIIFTLNNQQYAIISKRYKRRFCHLNRLLTPGFIRLDKK